jgi:hypothetical protein
VFFDRASRWKSDK